MDITMFGLLAAGIPLLIIGFMATHSETAEANETDK